MVAVVVVGHGGIDAVAHAHCNFRFPQLKCPLEVATQIVWQVCCFYPISPIVKMLGWADKIVSEARLASYDLEEANKSH